MGFGKSKPVTPRRMAVTFQDVAGVDGPRDPEEIVSARPAEAQRLGGKIRGVLSALRHRQDVVARPWFMSNAVLHLRLDF